MQSDCRTGTGFWTPRVKSWHFSAFLLLSLVHFIGKRGPHLYLLWNMLFLVFLRKTAVSTFPFWDGIYVLNSEAKSLDWAKFEQGKKGWIRHSREWQRHLVCSNLQSCSSWEGVSRTAKPIQMPLYTHTHTPYWKKTFIFMLFYNTIKLCVLSNIHIHYEGIRKC